MYDTAFGRTVTAFLVLMATMLIAASAGAAAPVTETTTVKDTERFVDVLTSCGEDAPLYEITIDYNSVEHTTTFDDGRTRRSPRPASSWPRRSSRMRRAWVRTT